VAAPTSTPPPPPPPPSPLPPIAALLWPPPRPPAFPPGPANDIAPAFLADPLATLDSLTARYGPLVGARLGGAWVVVVGDPAAAKDVLVDRAGSVFGKAGTAFFPASAVTGDGLLTSDGDSWRRQRQLAGPAFRRAAVEAYGGAMARAAGDLVGAGGAWGPAAFGRAATPVAGASTVRDVYADFNALTLTIVTDALFGGEAALGGPGQGARVSGAIATALSVFARRALADNPLAALLPEWVPTPDNRALQAAVAELDAVVYGVIAAARARQVRRGRERGE
jgi:cytochrome P450